MPQRPRGHVNETWSIRAFESLLPAEWLSHPFESDYGIDRRVEIFEGQTATGHFFNVQLKSQTTGSGQRPAVPIRRSTLNYWAELRDPTLIVIAHEPTQVLWFRWSHLLGQDENPDTKSRQVRCDEVLDEESAARLREEVAAYRLAQELTHHLPLDVYLSGATLYGESASSLKRAIGRKLSTLPSFFRIVHGNPTMPYLQVSIEDTRVMAGLRGNYSQQITWEFHGERDYNALASDVIASMALSCASVGAEDLAVRLLRLVVSDTHTLLEANGLGYAVALLARHEATDALLTLVRRTAAVEGHPARDIALAAFASTPSPPEVTRTVAYAIRDAARHWTRPAMGIYNAANLLRAVDSNEALRLYEEAAVDDPQYRNRGYWWREKGITYWARNETEAAESCYREAIALEDSQAVAYLADVLMRTGRYRHARDTLADAPIWESPDDAQWRLTLNALNLIVDDLGIDEQVRLTRAVPDFYPAPADDSLEALEQAALLAIREDALNGWAYSGLAAAWTGREEEEKDPLQATMTAAVIINVAGYLWIDLLIACLSDDAHDQELRMMLAQDAMLCAWKYLGESFAEEVFEHPFIDDELRALVLDFFETVRPPSPPLEMRRHLDDGTFESQFIPTDRRAATASD